MALCSDLLSDPVYGAGKHMSAADAERLIQALVLEGYFQEDRVTGKAGYATVRIRCGGKRLAAGTPISIQFRVKGAAAKV